jgi:hypothetical protein
MLIQYLSYTNSKLTAVSLLFLTDSLMERQPQNFRQLKEFIWDGDARRLLFSPS